MKALATLGRTSQELTDEEAKFLEKCFYMDDGMGSADASDDALRIICNLQPFLKKYGLQVHKVLSNSQAVMREFSTETAPLAHPTFAPENIPRALGVTWDTMADELHVILNFPERPFTRRGLLATTNSPFDPLGLAAPVLLGARLLQRQILSQFPAKTKAEWDAPLPAKFVEQWKEWLTSVKEEVSLAVPRCLHLGGKKGSARRQIHVYADASADAIGCVAYARSVSSVGEVRVVFISANSKLAPRFATSIPRLELCAALLAAWHAYSLLKELHDQIDEVFYYSDSTPVLGYLRNKSSCYPKFITRRVEAIHKFTKDAEWRYVQTTENPADLATRPTTPKKLASSSWFKGPEALQQAQLQVESCEIPEELPERFIENLKVCSTASLQVECRILLKAKEYGSWTRLVRVVRRLMQVVLPWLDRARQRLRVSLAPRPSEVSFRDAEHKLFHCSQVQSYPELFPLEVDTGLVTLRGQANHQLQGLSPIAGQDGLLRVGGRLRNSASPFEVKHPVILSSRSPLTSQYVQHIHESIPHQGRHITLSAVRQSGVFIVGGKRLVNNLIDQCVICRKLRGSTCVQLMADLPPERLDESAPFTHIGVDVFGNFYVHDGRTTRRKQGTKKIYVLMINCLVSRAVHLEPLETMDTSSVMLAFRRLFAIRGTCSTIRSDHGSNFVGALGQKDGFAKLQSEVEAKGITWTLNPVGASHHGGAYERKIGSVRRVLEAFFTLDRVALSREEFHTLLQEAAAVVNSTPLYVSLDSPDEPLAISPSNLLTLKTHSAFPIESTSFDELDLMSYGKRRWRRVQFLADSFWRRWREHYLQELTERKKWAKRRSNVSVGDVVLLREKNVPRGDWRIARVSEVFTGKDSLVRRVNVCLSDGKGKVRRSERAITDLVLLVSPGKPTLAGSVTEASPEVLSKDEKC